MFKSIMEPFSPTEICLVQAAFGCFFIFRAAAIATQFNRISATKASERAVISPRPVR